MAKTNISECAFSVSEVSAQKPHLLVFTPDLSSGEITCTKHNQTVTSVILKKNYGTASETTVNVTSETQVKFSQTISGNTYFHSDIRQAGQRQFSVTGNGSNLTGSETRNLTIHGVAASDCTVTLYHHSVPLVEYDGESFIRGNSKDFTFTSSRPDEGFQIVINEAVGLIEGQKTCLFEYIDASLVDIVVEDREYDGSYHYVLPPQVYYEDELLIADVEYKYSEHSRRDPGIYTETLTGLSQFRGTKDFTWKIKSPISVAIPNPDVSLMFSGLDKMKYYPDYDSPIIDGSTLKKLKYGVDYISTEEAIHAGQYSIELTGIGSYAGTTIVDISVWPIDISRVDIYIPSRTALFSHDNNFVEDGQVKIYYRGVDYSSSSPNHYTVEVVDSADVSLDASVPGWRTVTYKGKNDLYGERVENNFKLNSGILGIRSKVDEFDFDGEVHDWYRVFCYKYGEGGDLVESSANLVEGVDYEINPTDELYSDADLRQTADGSAPAFVRMTGLGGFAGQSSDKFYDETLMNLADVSSLDISVRTVGVSMNPTDYVDVSMFGNYDPQKYEDFEITNFDTSGPGPQTATLVGKNHFHGTIDVSFNVEKTDLDDCSVELIPSSFTYNAQPQYPEVIRIGKFTQGVDYELLTPDNCVDASLITATVIALPGSLYVDGSTQIQYEIKPLQSSSIRYSKVNAGNFCNEILTPVPNPVYQETDYDVSCPDASNAGTYTAELIYKQTNILGANRTFEWEIKPKDILSGSVYVSPQEYFTGHKVYPTVTDLACEYTLEKDRDFTVISERDDLVNCTTIAHVRLQGKGNYGNTRMSDYYKILPVHTSLCDCSLIDASSLVFDGTPKTPAFVFKYKDYDPVVDWDYTYEYVHNTFGRASLRITGCQHSTNPMQASTYHGNLTGIYNWYFDIAPADFADAVITQDASVFTYDGSTHKSNFTVQMNGNTLTEGSDYIFTSKPDNMINAGVYTYTIKPVQGKMSGPERSFTMTINKRTASLSELTLNPSFANQYVYNGQPQTPPVNYLQFNQNNVKVYPNQDFTYSYSDNIYAGTASLNVTFAASANFSGTLSYEFTISPLNISNATLTTIPTPVLWTGRNARPPMKVSYAGIELPTADYTVTYLNCDSAGNATVRVTSTEGASIYGTRDVNFVITKPQISDVVISGLVEHQTYDGTDFTPDPFLTWTTRYPWESPEDATTYTLINNTDYTVQFPLFIEPGQKDIVFTGAGNFQGTETRTVFIDKRDISLCEIDNVLTKEYNRNAQSQSPVITDSNGTYSSSAYTLIKDTDYTLSYLNNVNAGTATMIVTPIGHYTGEAQSRNFTITPIDVSDVSFILNEDSLPYAGLITRPSGYDVYCPKIDYHLDYTEDFFEVEYSEDDYPGTATAYLHLSHNYTGDTSVHYTVEKIPVTWPNITLECDPEDFTFIYNKYEDNPTGEASTYKYRPTGANIDSSNFNYDEPSRRQLVQDTDYTLSFDYGNEIPQPFGLIRVTMTGAGDYYQGSRYIDVEMKKRTFESIDPSLHETAYIYTHQPITVSYSDIDVSAIPGRVTLNSSDASLVYHNNIDAGVNTATVTLHPDASSNYVNDYTFNYTIYYDITDSVNYVLIPKTLVYNATRQYPIASFTNYLVSSEGEPIVEGRDFEFTYLTDGVNAGTHTIRVTGKGNYRGSFEFEYQILQRNIKLSEVTLTPDEFQFNYEVQVPTQVTVTGVVGNLVENTDYTVELLTDGTNIGTHTIRITGIGNFTDYQDVTYRIVARSLDPDWLLTQPSDVVIDYSKALSDDYWTESGALIKYGTHVLQPGTDFDIEFEDMPKQKVVNPSSGQYEDQIFPWTTRMKLVGQGDFGGYVMTDAIDVRPLDVSTLEISQTPDTSFLRVISDGLSYQSRHIWMGAQPTYDAIDIAPLSLAWMTKSEDPNVWFPKAPVILYRDRYNASHTNPLIWKSPCDMTEDLQFVYESEATDVYVYNSSTLPFEDWDRTHTNHPVLHVYQSIFEDAKAWNNSHDNYFSAVKLIVPGSFKINYLIDDRIYASYEETEGELLDASLQTPEYEVPYGWVWTGWQQTLPCTMPGDDLNITSYTERHQMTVHWMVDDEEYATVDLLFEDRIPDIASPARRPGYIFSGWSSHPEFADIDDVYILGYFIADEDMHIVDEVPVFRENLVHNLTGESRPGNIIADTELFDVICYLDENLEIAYARAIGLRTDETHVIMTGYYLRVTSPTESNVDINLAMKKDDKFYAVTWFSERNQLGEIYALSDYPESVPEPNEWLYVRSVITDEDNNKFYEEVFDTGLNLSYNGNELKIQSSVARPDLDYPSMWRCDYTLQDGQSVRLAIRKDEEFTDISTVVHHVIADEIVDETVTFTKTDAPYAWTIMPVKYNIYDDFDADFWTIFANNYTVPSDEYVLARTHTVYNNVHTREMTCIKRSTYSAVTITVLSEGEVYDTYTGEPGESVEMRTDYTREGYEFSGYTSTYTQFPSTDVTTEIIWTEITPQPEPPKTKYITVRFLVNNSVYNYVRTAAPVELSTIIPPSPAIVGYIWTGWSSTSGTLNADTDITSTLSSAPSGTRTLTYKVDNQTYKQYAVVPGEPCPVQPYPVKAGKTFSGWNPEVPAAMPNSNVTCSGTFQ